MNNKKTIEKKIKIRETNTFICTNNIFTPKNIRYSDLLNDTPNNSQAITERKSLSFRALD